jgi:hypothetical protein
LCSTAIGGPSRRLNNRSAALEKAGAKAGANDPLTAEKYYKQAVGVPAEFISWIINHVKGMSRVSVVVAPFEADAQCAQLQVSTSVCRVETPLRLRPDRARNCAVPGEWSGRHCDIRCRGLGLPRLRDEASDLQPLPDGLFHEVDVFDDVLGQAIGRCKFGGWSFAQFRVWSC